MHLRAEYQGLLSPITYQILTPGKLEQWVEENPQADVKEVKKVKKRIRLARKNQSERPTALHNCVSEPKH